MTFASPGSQPPSARHSVDELGARGAVDRAVDAAAAEQARVGGVDDRLGASRRVVMSPRCSVIADTRITVAEAVAGNPQQDCGRATS